MDAEPLERVQSLVAELKAAISASTNPQLAEYYARALLDAPVVLPQYTDEYVKAAYARKTPADDPSSWDDFDPAACTVTAEEFLTRMMEDERAGGKGNK